MTEEQALRAFVIWLRRNGAKDWHPSQRKRFEYLLEAYASAVSFRAARQLLAALSVHLAELMASEDGEIAEFLTDHDPGKAIAGMLIEIGVVPEQKTQERPN